jgi:hypothetical protein
MVGGPFHRPIKLQKRGRIEYPSPFWVAETSIRQIKPYLAFSAFFSAGLLSLGAAGAAGAGSLPGAGAIAPG